MSFRPITSSEAPAPSGGYSQALVAGDLLFLSGQGPFDAEGRLVGDSLEAQVRQVFSNLEAVAQAAGSSLKEFVRVGVYLSDMSNFDEMDRIYRQIFSEPRPARTTIQTKLVDFLIEADAVAYLAQ